MLGIRVRPEELRVKLRNRCVFVCKHGAAIGLMHHLFFRGASGCGLLFRGGRLVNKKKKQQQNKQVDLPKWCLLWKPDPGTSDQPREPAQLSTFPPTCPINSPAWQIEVREATMSRGYKLGQSSKDNDSCCGHWDFGILQVCVLQ